MSLSLQPLSAAHRRAIDVFECDSPELVVYLRRWALRHQERDRLSRTWIALDGDSLRIVGYFSLAAASVERARFETGDIARLPRFPIPGILLARLAVDSRVQGQGVGRWMFEEALRMTLTIAENSAGIRVFIADAKDERALRFYAKLGMVEFGSGWPRRMYVDLKSIG